MKKWNHNPAAAGADAQAQASGKMMDLIMPAMSLFISFGLSGMLGVYWIYQSVFSILQSFILSKVMPMPTFTEEEIKEIWKNFQGRAQELELPSAPKQFLQYFEEPDRPQAKLDRDLEGGMAVTLGRLRPDTQYDYKFVCLSHNTLRGAAGGAVLLAELLCAEGYIEPIADTSSSFKY